MARAKLSDVRAQMEKLIKKEKQIEEELAMEFGKYIVKHHPEIETITEFKEWHSKAVDSIDWIMKKKEEREQFSNWTDENSTVEQTHSGE